MTLIKSISGIRGTIGGKPGEGLSPIDIVKFTAAYATFIQQKAGKTNVKIVVGRDARLSGMMICSLVVSTLVAMGCDVVNIGLATTPTTEIAVPKEKADGGIIRMDCQNKIVFAANIQNGLEIINFSDPAVPQRIAHYHPGKEIYDVIVDGHLLYMASWSDGIEVLNISNPSQPFLISQYFTSSGFIALLLEDSYLYAINHQGLSIIDVSDPTFLHLAGTFAMADAEFWMPCYGNGHLFIPDHGSGPPRVIILNVEDPLHVSHVGDIADCLNPSQVFYDQGYLYIADSEYGIHIVDCRGIDAIKTVGKWPIPDAPFDVWVDASIIYVSLKDFGLRIYEFSR